MPKEVPDRGKYLSTGWRVVGRGAEALVEHAAAQSLERLDSDAVDRTLYAVQFTLAPAVQGRPTVEVLLDSLADDIRRTWQECPRLVRDEEVSRPASRFGGLRYDILSEPGKEWSGEILWRAVHPVVAGAPITTRVLIEERPSFTRVNLRVTADQALPSVRGFIGAGQAQPYFLRILQRDGLTPSWLGGPLQPTFVQYGEVPDLVENMLEDPERKAPAVILSPLAEGGYVVKPADLAWELLGRARLYVLQDHRQTFELTDTVGDRQMSCYWGAAHAYMPGWSRHDDPYDHPLLVSDRLADPVMRAGWLGELGVFLGTRLALPPSIADRRAAKSATAETAKVAPTSSSTADLATPDTTPDKPAAASREVADPHPLLEIVIAEIRKLGDTMDGLADEVERLRTISAVRSSSTSAIERRLARLEDILAEIFPDGRAATPGRAVDDRPSVETEPDVDEGRQTLVEVVQDVAESHSDALVFLDSAVSSAADSPYEDPERVRAILEVMARVARRRRDGVLGTSLREAFADLGIDYRGAIAKTTSARMREQYRFSRDGDLIEAEEHIVLGNTYDPRRCLRIYFSSRVVNDPRFIVAHVGRHFEIKTST